MSAPQLDDRYESIREQVDVWRDEFTKSPAFSELNALQQNCAGNIIQAFAECAYRYLNATPENWDAEIVQECCTEILPRKIARGPWFFEALDPVLGLFFRFLEENRFLAQGRSLAHAVENVNLAIIVNSENPVRWGPAKSFVMAAREAGIDVRNPEALVAWCDQMNQRAFSGPFDTSERHN